MKFFFFLNARRNVWVRARERVRKWATGIITEKKKNKSAGKYALGSLRGSEKKMQKRKMERESKTEWKGERERGRKGRGGRKGGKEEGKGEEYVRA